MRLFTNNTQTRYFTTDQYFSNLQAIEVSSIEDAISSYTLCDPMVFIGHYNLYANKHGELYTQKHRDSSNKAIVFDFMEELTEAEIAHQVIASLDFDGAETFINKVKKVWQCRWVNVNVVVDNVETVQFDTYDSSQILVEINHDEEIITTHVVSSKYGGHIHAATA